MIREPGTVIPAPTKFLLIQRIITGIVPRTFRRYQVPQFSKLSIHRLSSNRLLARRAKVGHQPSSATLSSLLLALSQSLISSTIRTSRPTLPRLSVGGGRTVPVTVYPRGSPLPGPPSIHNRVVTARCPSPARPPLITVPDRSKGVAPSVLNFTSVHVGFYMFH